MEIRKPETRGLHSTTRWARVRRTVILVPAVLAAAAILSACGAKTEDPPHPYCPLKNGLKWTYRAVTLGTGGSSMEGGIETRVDGSETLNGKDYARFVTNNTAMGSGEADIVYFRSAPEGVFYVKSFQTDEPEQLYLPADPKQGMTWNVVTGTTHLQNTVDGFETVEVGGRKYECVRVSSRGNLLAGTETVAISGITYYARGVGQVKSQMTTMGEGGERIPMSITLVAFSD